MPVNNTEPLSVYRAGPGYAKCLSDIILAASRAPYKRGFLDHLLQMPEASILRLLGRLAMHPAQEWGRIDNTFAALVDGVCAGTVTVREKLRPCEFPFTPEALRDVARHLGMDAPQVEAVLTRQRTWLAHLPIDAECPPGVWQAHYLGARREFRGGGVARGLMERAIGEITASGGTALELLCAMGNTRAEQLFASLGFTVVEERRFGPGFEHLGIGTRRWRLALRA